MFWRLYLPFAAALAATAAFGRLVPTVVVALAGTGLLGWILSRRHTRSLAELTRLAESLAGGDLRRRSIAPHGDELGGLTTSLHRLAEGLDRTLRQSDQDRTQLRAILDGVAEGLIAMDPQGRVVLANAGAAPILRFPPEAAVGRPGWEVLREPDLASHAAEAARSGRPMTERFDLPSGRTWEAHVRPRPSGLLLVLRDVTEPERFQDLRREFVANASHELRTPLTLIRGFVETLREGAWTDPVKGPEYLETIARHVDRLERLVLDLLDLSRLESREGMLRKRTVEAGALIRKAVEPLLPGARARNQSVEVRDDPLPEVLADPELLERAVSNLVDNAIKFTPEGGSIAVTATARDGVLSIEVSDTGLGIAPEDLPRIFERFYRVDKSRSRELGGTGLGLSIVKHIAQAHGGTVEVESAPGKGSRFRLKIPLA